MPQDFTSWEAIYLTLRAAFPDAHYHTGAALEGFENVNETAFVNITGHGQIPPFRERGNSSRDVDSSSARLAKNNADSPTGSSRAFFKATTATNQWIAATEVTLKDGHKAPDGLRP